MANEFTGLEIKCERPYVFPDGPNASPGHQSCAILGSSPDSLTVDGSKYIFTAFTYTRAHLWRNFGIIVGWFIFFVVLTMLGMEMQRPNKGGSSVIVFKRDEAPQGVRDAIMNPGESKDEESKTNGSNDTEPIQEKQSNGSTDLGSSISNTAIFTWKDVNYVIPYKGGQRKLLQNVQGYVKPGRLTALMGASGAG